jgi:hypothetical protein
LSVAIAIEVGSPNSELNRVRATVRSLIANIGTGQYKLIIAVAPSIPQPIKDYIHSLKNDHNNIVELMPEKEYLWADFINEAIKRAEGFKYFIKSHDDIELLTPDFLPRVEETLRKIREPVGWISFMDKDYLNGHWAPSTRPGFHRDHVFENAWLRRKMFQFHNLPENWWRPPLFKYYAFIIESIARHRLHIKPHPMPLYSKEYYAALPYDFPNAPVKCHAPFNHFVLIELEKLKQIGDCERWGTYNALLVDEDWGLRALQLGLNNIWIPDIEYIHYRPGGGTRSGVRIAKDQNRVGKLFYEKWGFNSEGRAEEMKYIKEEFKNTNIPWSIDRRSFEWDYIK